MLPASGAVVVVCAYAVHGHDLPTEVLARVEAHPAVAVAPGTTLKAHRTAIYFGAGEAAQLFIRRRPAALRQVTHQVSATCARRGGKLLELLAANAQFFGLSKIYGRQQLAAHDRSAGGRRVTVFGVSTRIERDRTVCSPGEAGVHPGLENMPVRH